MKNFINDLKKKRKIIKRLGFKRALRLSKLKDQKRYFQILKEYSLNDLRYIYDLYRN